MKKGFYRIFRRVRRNIARFIVGYDRCPIDCRKNYREIAVARAEIVLFAAGAVGIFLAITLLFN